jgi:hypothetical protein
MRLAYSGWRVFSVTPSAACWALPLAPWFPTKRVGKLSQGMSAALTLSLFYGCIHFYPLNWGFAITELLQHHRPRHAMLFCLFVVSCFFRLCRVRATAPCHLKQFPENIDVLISGIASGTAGSRDAWMRITLVAVLSRI